MALLTIFLQNRGDVLGKGDRRIGLERRGAGNQATVNGRFLDRDLASGKDFGKRFFQITAGGGVTGGLA